MKILGMGMPELLIILAVVLLIFGPKNLPKLGASLGQTVKGLRDGLGGDKKEAEAEATLVEETEDADEVEQVSETPAASAGKTTKVTKKKAPAAESVA